MKRAVLAVATVFYLGVASAAPAPVEDVSAMSQGDKVAMLERMMKAKQQSEFEMQQRLDQLQQDVLDLRGLTEQQSYQINQMLQRQRQLYDEIANLTAKSSEQAVTVAPTSTVPAATNVSLSETASYEQAVNLVLKQRKYDEAIPAFGQFIEKYPNSTYAANANYWLGQLLYNKQDFAKAKSAFMTVVEKFPKSNKRGDSLVKLGLISEKSGDATAAQGIYNEVVKLYPNSAAARIAKQQLAAIKS